MFVCVRVCFLSCAVGCVCLLEYLVGCVRVCVFGCSLFVCVRVYSIVRAFACVFGRWCFLGVACLFARLIVRVFVWLCTCLCACVPGVCGLFV